MGSEKSEADDRAEIQDEASFSELADSAVVTTWEQVVANYDWQRHYDSRRIFHGRGRCYPGLEGVCLDLYEGIVLLTLYSELDQTSLEWLISQLTRRLSSTSCRRLLIQKRYLPGAPIEEHREQGYSPAEVSALSAEALARGYARRGELRFNLNFEQQNVGYFLDMEQGRRWLEQRSKGKRVLNLFSYTCAFSVVGKAAGAVSVMNVDMSKRALRIGRDNHHINQLSTEGVDFSPLDIMKSWGRIRRAGPFDIIIIDPPSAQKDSFNAERDYIKVVRRLAELAAPGADILACLNAPHLPEVFIRDLFEPYPQFRFVERLPAHPDFPDTSADAALKLLWFQS